MARKNNNTKSTSFNPSPVTRLEKFLAAIAGLVNAPTPVTRKEYWMSKTAARIKAIEEGGGGGGATYTGEDGIIVNNTTHVISPDTTVLATKNEVAKVYIGGTSTDGGFYKKFSLYANDNTIIGKAIELNLDNFMDWSESFVASGNIYKSEKRVAFSDTFSDFFYNYSPSFIDTSVDVWSSDPDSYTTNAWGRCHINVDTYEFVFYLYSPDNISGPDLDYLHIHYKITAIGCKYL